MITDKEIFELLKPHFTALRKFHDDGLEKVNQIMDIMGVTMYKRSKANDFNNYVIEKAKAYFRNIDGIEVIDKYETLVLSFTSVGLLSRFKKISKYTLLSNCADNKRNTALIEGNTAYIQGTLYVEYPPAVFVEIGYIINQLWTFFEKIMVVKRVDKVAIELFQIPQLEIAKPYTLKAVDVDPEKEEEKKREENQLTLKNKTQK